MGTAFSRIWDVVYFVSSSNLVAPERKHVYSQDYGMCIPIVSYNGNPDSLENPANNLVFRVTFLFRKLFM